MTNTNLNETLINLTAELTEIITTEQVCLTIKEALKHNDKLELPNIKAMAEFNSELQHLSPSQIVQDVNFGSFALVDEYFVLNEGQYISLSEHEREWMLDSWLNVVVAELVSKPSFYFDVLETVLPREVIDLLDIVSLVKGYISDYSETKDRQTEGAN